MSKILFPDSPVLNQEFVIGEKTFRFDGTRWVTYRPITAEALDLENVNNFDIASQAEAEAGTSNEKYMTPLRTKEAILELSPPTDLTSVNSHIADTTIHFTQSAISITESQISDFGSYEPANANIQSHISTTTGNPHNVTKTDVGLGNVTNDAQIPLTQKGANSGVAELDANGKVPSAQLPSFVDDVLEYANLAAFPTTGESGKIYITQDTNKTYRWSGSAYVVISETLALGETSTTAYRGDRGKTAYDHSQLTSGNPHNVTAAEVGAEPAFTKNTAFNKDFGTTAGTVTQGNDSRLSDARTPTAHTHAFSEITSTPTTLAGYGITDAYPSSNPSGYQTAAQVSTAISGLVDSAPATLDTLNELAAALGNDPNFATTISTNIAGKVSKAGDTMTGQLSLFNTNASIDTLKLQFDAGGGGNWGINPFIVGISNGGLSFVDRLNSTTPFVISNSGNVGIGTSSPQSKLEIKGANVYDSVKSITLTHAEPTTYSGFIGLRQEGLAYTHLTFGTRSNNVDYLETLNIGNGNVGIGKTTPASILHINTKNGASIANTVILDRPASNSYHAVSFATEGTVDWSIGQNSTGGFQIYEDGASAKTRLVIKDGGNVGIGTTAPGSKLQISDGNTVYPTNYSFSIEKNEEGYGMFMGVLGSGVSWIQGGTVNASAYYGIALQPSGGNIGIGTTSPGEKLEVAGNIKAQQVVLSDSSNVEKARIVYDSTSQSIKFTYS
jgi:hypothetical protein